MERFRRGGVAFGWPGIVTLLRVAFVLLAAIAVGAYWVASMRWIAAERRDHASSCAREVRNYERIQAWIDAGLLPEFDDNPWAKKWIAQSLRFYKLLEQKYLAAAARPWTEVPVDNTIPPPMPDHVFWAPNYKPPPFDEPSVRTQAGRWTISAGRGSSNDPPDCASREARGREKTRASEPVLDATANARVN